MPRCPRAANPFRYFKTSPEVIRLAVVMYVRFPLSLRNVEDLLFERCIEPYLRRAVCIGLTPPPLTYHHRFSCIAGMAEICGFWLWVRPHASGACYGIAHGMRFGRYGMSS